MVAWRYINRPNASIILVENNGQVFDHNPCPLLGSREGDEGRRARPRQRTRLKRGASSQAPPFFARCDPSIARPNRAPSLLRAFTDLTSP